MAWEVKKLGEVCELKKGKQPNLKKTPDTGDLPYLVARYLRGFEETSYASRNDASSVFVTKKDLFIICDGSNSGETFLGFEGVLSSTMAIIHHGREIDTRFLRYFLIINLEGFKKSKTGAAIPHLDLKGLRDLELPIPPIPEQLRIVEILDQAFESIAKAKENDEKNLKNAKEIFESYLQSVFENKGDGWEKKMLKEVGETQTGTTPKTSDRANYGNYISFITPAEINIFGDGGIRYCDEGLSKQGLKKGRKMEKNSILMVCIGASIGKVGFVDRDVSCNQQINSLTVKREFHPKFFYYALRTKSFFEQVLHNSAQATLPIINKSKWETLYVNYPNSIDEQKNIVTKLDALMQETKKLKAFYNKKIADLEELQKSILDKAFKGELTEESV